MTVRDVLQKDFIEEVQVLGQNTNKILDEDIDTDLRHAQSLRTGDSFSFYSLPLYVVCRIFKPEIVIETGTQNGGSAQAILCALQKNDLGILHSIDSGNQSTDGTHRDTRGSPGQGISPHLKKRWGLKIGMSYDKLPELLKIINTVDLFFHDSDHSKSCVEFEFREVLKSCKKESLVGLHDHYGQWDHESILSEFQQIIGNSRPPIHRDQNGNHHNVLRLWKKI